ncbi:MAG: RNA methyltransferase, partial [Alphaproteobacteria bacterium]
SAGQQCGFLFGAEKAGLTNDHIALADAIVSAPVNPEFASLNLAQSVLLVAYEWLKQGGAGGLGRKTAFDGPAREGLQMQQTRPATRAELTGFFEHLERELDASGFLRPPEKRPVMVRNIRNLFHRTGATEQEVRTLRGIVSSLVKGRRDRESRQK